ncbi:hypothetical protein [Caballeronia sp. dw_19]|uniref:hypothetical protein n=1 Tax=Caballeronia sp. dw_19 TaxID=2719791 RepID=UPI002107E265|nr:hypothetical protein [Caballeronia sp. dw_19]
MAFPGAFRRPRQLFGQDVSVADHFTHGIQHCPQQSIISRFTDHIVKLHIEFRIGAVLIEDAAHLRHQLHQPPELFRRPARGRQRGEFFFCATLYFQNLLQHSLAAR